MKYCLQKGFMRGIVSTSGGELVSLRDASETEFIWQGDPAIWTGRNPILFPIVGALKEGKVRFPAGLYQMPQHGFARHSEFTVAAQTAESISLTLRESPATLAQYPYPFLLKVRHTLLSNGFSTEFTVENIGTEPLPFCIGGHTAFRCPIYRGESFEDYQLVFDETEQTGSLLRTAEGMICMNMRDDSLRDTNTIPLEYRLFDEADTLIYTGLHSSGVALLNRATGHGVHMDFSGFPLIAFWTKPNAQAPYLCMEPWHGLAATTDESGLFTDKPFCITLLSAQRRTLGYTATIF